MARLPDADQGGLPLPRLDSCGADCAGPGAIPGSFAARRIKGHSRMAELLLQISDDGAAALSRARPVHSADEVEEYAAMDGGRRFDHAPRPGILRLTVP